MSRTVMTLAAVLTLLAMSDRVSADAQSGYPFGDQGPGSHAAHPGLVATLSGAAPTPVITSQPNYPFGAARRLTSAAAHAGFVALAAGARATWMADVARPTYPYGALAGQPSEGGHAGLASAMSGTPALTIVGQR